MIHVIAPPAIAGYESGVPLFYFHICNGDGFTEDEEGQSLADEASARAVAVANARDIMAAEMRAGQLNPASFIEVEDGDHRHLFTVAFSEAYTINLPKPS